MNPDQLIQLANLLKELQQLNQLPGRLYVGEAIIYDADNRPLAKLEYGDSAELEFTAFLGNDL